MKQEGQRQLEVDISLPHLEDQRVLKLYISLHIGQLGSGKTPVA